MSSGVQRQGLEVVAVPERVLDMKVAKPFADVRQCRCHRLTNSELMRQIPERDGIRWAQLVVEHPRDTDRATEPVDRLQRELDVDPLAHLDQLDQAVGDSADRPVRVRICQLPPALDADEIDPSLTGNLENRARLGECLLPSGRVLVDHLNKRTDRKEPAPRPRRQLAQAAPIPVE